MEKTRQTEKLRLIRITLPKPNSLSNQKAEVTYGMLSGNVYYERHIEIAIKESLVKEEHLGVPRTCWLIAWEISCLSECIVFFQ